MPDLQSRPEQLKLEFALWTKMAVLLLVRQEFDLALPICTMGEYLKHWGFMSQKPIERVYEQRPEASRAMDLNEQYPEIAKRTKTEDAKIDGGDEIAVVNTDVRGRGCQPYGQAYVAFAVDGTRHKLIEFLWALIKDACKKLFLMLDNLRVHRSKLGKAWLAEHQALPAQLQL